MTMKKEATELKIFFDRPKIFEMKNIKPLSGLTGLYFIFTDKITIQYPFEKSRLLYIGMSEKKTNSMRSRLTGHFEGKSKNLGLVNYRKAEQLFFTYINFEMLHKSWNYGIEDLESYFILDRLKKKGYGAEDDDCSGFFVSHFGCLLSFLFSA